MEEKRPAVKASFKIEINEEEKKARDSQKTTVYHTGQALIQIDEEDLKEIEKKKMEEIEEGVGDEDEEDDPDDDLNI